MNRREALNTIAAAGLLLTATSKTIASPSPYFISSKDPRFDQNYLNTDNGQIYYWTAGSGPNVVFIHQSGNSAEEFAALVPLLADRFRLIAMDLPGHGRSDDPKQEPTVDDYTLAVQQLLDHLDIQKAHLVGHHGGALTAMNLITHEPKRFGKAIFSGIGGVRSAEENQAFIDSIMNIDRTVRAESDFVANTWERYMKMMSDGANPTDMLRPFIAFLQARLRPYQGVLVNLKWDKGNALAKLRGPVLLVQGDKDNYVSGQENLLNIIPQSTRIVMPGCGTFMFYDKPKECAAMITNYLVKGS